MVAIGIDFGTSTTVVAGPVGDAITCLPLDENRPVFPTCVAFPPAGGVVTGGAARYRRPIDPENTLFSMKRIIGLPWTSEVVTQFAARYPFKLEADAQGTPCFCTRAGKLAVVDVCAQFLAPVRAAAAARCGGMDQLVVGVPSDFAAPRRAAIVEAIAKAGFAGAACIDEPLAIAHAYLANVPVGPNDMPYRVAVYDIGGGTFNLALCEVHGRRVTVLASGGDEYLGGDDIDQACADWIAQEVLRQYHWDLRTSPQSATRLLVQSEQAKIRLSQAALTPIKLSAIEAGDTFAGRELTLERPRLESWAIDLVRRTFVICDEVMATAGLTRQDLAGVLLAGGTTCMLAVQQAVGQYFKRPMRTSTQPDQLVALGAAIAARDRAATKDGESREAPAPAPGPERRAAPRRRVSMPVLVSLPGKREPERLFAADISTSGMFIATAYPLQVNAEIVIWIDVGAPSSFAVRARVVRRSALTDGTTGVAVEFAGLNAEQQQQLSLFVARAASLFVGT